MPILLIGALAGGWLVHAFHTEVKRQAHQEARLNELHDKLSEKLAATQKK